LETEPRLGTFRNRNPFETLRRIVLDSIASLRGLRGRLRSPKPSPERLEEVGRGANEITVDEADSALDLDTGNRRRSTVRAVFGNFPLVLGGILAFALILLVFIGPALAPHSPYQNQALRMTDGELTTPPFPPSEISPWGTDLLGRDLQSLILTGLQQTLILAFLAVASRVAVGVILGAVAGWRSGSLLDRTIQGIADILTAYPTLLLTMIFILAFGIRKGMSSFVLALCLVGWGEIMRYVRSEVISIRPKPFIESAIAVGSRPTRILSRHIIPNLFSGLISVIALEIGSVLMLLGELGFISIFIGGGIVVLTSFGSVHYSDVPEWGSLLSNLRLQVRSYPWTGLYPMLAFFLAILSFNLFSEGLRRLADEGHLIIGRLINRYTIGAAVFLLVAVGWLRSNSGSLPFYRESARDFDAQNAMAHLRDLTAPEMEGRAIGSDGIGLAADYLGEQFDDYGLQPAGEASTFFQERSRDFEILDATPALTVEDGGTPLVYGEDFAAYPGRNMTDGEVEAPVRLVVLGELISSSPGAFRSPYPELERADFSDEIVMTFSDSEASILSRVPKAGLLVVSDDPAMFKKRFTLSGRSGATQNFFTGQRTGDETPAIWISEETAGRILEGSEYDLDQLRAIREELNTGEVLDVALASRVGMDVDGSLVEASPVRNVIGYIPGTHS
ncbi:MAG TPA: ABC transporter permease subunit, partial [Anaerolineales bacterium]|nr:ABC transporter permease subunit [Anaerolineales bacterium]